MGTRLAVTLAGRSASDRMPQPLNEGLAEIGARVDAAKRVAVLLDFDGTLAEIAATPELAQMKPGMRAALLSLRHEHDVVVAIVSGRALEDVRERVGIPELIYAGCHGLVIRGPGLDFLQPQAQRAVPALKRLAEQLAPRLRHIAGVLVEDKVLGISVHFRQVAARDRQEVALAVQTIAGRSDWKFRVRRGREVWEISPTVDWDKGRAVRWILARAAGRDALPIFIGDDVTDEDAFVALPEGITIRVGQAAESSAAWSVAGPEEVGTFLLWLGSRLR